MCYVSIMRHLAHPGEPHPLGLHEAGAAQPRPHRHPLLQQLGWPVTSCSSPPATDFLGVVTSSRDPQESPRALAGAWAGTWAGWNHLQDLYIHIYIYIYIYMS